MAPIRILAAATAAVFIFAAGFAFAQGGLMPYPRPDPAVIAAQEALEEAMQNLQNARAPNASGITRAKAYIALAHTELSPVGGVQGLQRDRE